MQHHAPKVSHRHYDKDLPNLKMNATSWLEKVSGGGQLEAEEIPEAVQAKRRKRDLEDQMASREAAKRVLAAADKRSNPVKLR